MLLQISVLLSTLLPFLDSLPITVNGVRDASALLPLSWNTELEVEFTLNDASYTLDIVEEEEEQHSCHKQTSVLHSVSLTQKPQNNVFAATITPEVIRAVLEPAASFTPTYYISLRQTASSSQDYIQRWEVALQPPSKESALDPSCFTFDPHAFNFFDAPLQANNMFYTVTAAQLDYVPLFYLSVISLVNSGQAGCEAYNQVSIERSWIVTFNDLYQDCRGLCPPPAQLSNTHYYDANSYLHQRSAHYEFDLVRLKPASTQILTQYELPLYIHFFISSDAGPGYLIIPLTLQFEESYIFSKYRFTNICNEISSNTCSFPAQPVQCPEPIEFDQNIQLGRVPHLKQCGLNTLLLLDKNRVMFDWVKAAEVTDQAPLFNHLQTGFYNSYLQSQDGKRLDLPLMADNAFYWMLNGDFWRFFGYRRIGEMAKAELCTMLDNCSSPWCTQVTIPSVLKYPDYPSCATINRFLMKQHQQIVLYPQSVSTLQDLEIQFTGVIACSLDNPRLADVVVSPYPDINSDYLSLDSYDNLSCIQTILECNRMQGLSSAISLYECISYDDKHFNFCELVETDEEEFHKCVYKDQCYIGIPRVDQFVALKQGGSYKQCQKKFCLFPSPQTYHVPQITMKKRCTQLSFLECGQLISDLKALLEPYPFKFSPRVPSNEELIVKQLREHSSFSGTTLTISNLKQLSQLCSNCILYLHQFQVESRDNFQDIFYKVNELKFELESPPSDVILTLESPTLLSLQDALPISVYSKSKIMNIDFRISLEQQGRTIKQFGSGDVELSAIQKYRLIMYGAKFDSTQIKAEAVGTNNEVVALVNQAVILNLPSYSSVLPCGSFELKYSLNYGSEVKPNSLGFVEITEGDILSIQGMLVRQNCNDQAEVLQIFIRAEEDLNKEEAQHRELAAPKVSDCGYLPLYCEDRHCMSLQGDHFQNCQEMQDSRGVQFTKCNYNDNGRRGCVISWNQRALINDDTAGNALREKRIHPLHQSECRLDSDLSKCPFSAQCMLGLRTNKAIPQGCNLDKLFTSVQNHPSGLYLQFYQEELNGRLSSLLRALKTAKGRKINILKDVWEQGEQEFWVHAIVASGQRPLYLKKKVSLVKLVGRQQSNVAVPYLAGYQFGFDLYRVFDDILTEIKISLLGVQSQFTELYQIIMSTPEGNIVSLEPNKDVFKISWQEAVRWFKYNGMKPRTQPLSFQLVFKNSWILPTARRELNVIYAPPNFETVNYRCELLLESIQMVSGSSAPQTVQTDQNGSYVLTGSRITLAKFKHDMQKCNPEILGGWEYDIEIIPSRMMVLQLDCGDRLTCSGLSQSCEMVPLKCSTPIQDMVFDNGLTTYTCIDIYGQNYINSCYAMEDQNKKRFVRCDLITLQPIPLTCVINDLLIPHPLQFEQAQLKPALSFDVNNFKQCFIGNFDVCPFKEACFIILHEVMRYPDLQGCGVLKDLTQEYISAWIQFIGPQIHSKQYSLLSLASDPRSRWFSKAEVTYPDATTASILLPRFHQTIPDNSFLFIHALAYQKEGKDKPVFTATSRIPVVLWQPPAQAYATKSEYYFSGLEQVETIPYDSSLEIVPRTEAQDPTYSYQYSGEIRKASDLSVIQNLNFAGGKFTISAAQIIKHFGLTIEENRSDLVLILRRRALDSQNNPRYELDVEVQVKPRMMPPDASGITQACVPIVYEISFSSGSALTKNPEGVYAIGIEELNGHQGEDLELEFSNRGCTGGLYELFAKNADNFKREIARIAPGQSFPSLCRQELLFCSNGECKSQFLDKTYSNCQEKTDSNGQSYTLCPTQEEPRCVVKNPNELHPKERTELGGCFDPERTAWADGRCGLPPFCIDSTFDMSTITLINYTEIIKLLLREHTFTISDISLRSFRHFLDSALWQGLGAQSTVDDIQSQFLRVARLTSRDILLALFPDIKEVCQHFYYFKNRGNTESLLLQDSQLAPPLQIGIQKPNHYSLKVPYQEAIRLARESQIHEIYVNFIYTSPENGPVYGILPLKLQFSFPADYTFEVKIEPHIQKIYTIERLRLVAKVYEYDMSQPFQPDRFEIMWRCPPMLESFCTTQFLPIRVTASHAEYISILEIPANSASSAMSSELRVSVSKKDTWASIEQRTQVEYEVMNESKCLVQILTPDLHVSSTPVRIEWTYSQAICTLQEIIFQIRKDNSECRWCGLIEQCSGGRGYSQINSNEVPQGMHQIQAKFSFLRGGVSETVNRRLIVRKSNVHTLSAHFGSIIKTVGRSTEHSIKLQHNSSSRLHYDWLECPSEMYSRCAVDFTDSIEITTRDAFQQTSNRFKVRVSSETQSADAQISLVVTSQSLAGLSLQRTGSPASVHYLIKGGSQGLTYRWVGEAVNSLTKQVSELGFRTMTSDGNHLSLDLSQIQEGALVIIQAVVSSQTSSVTFKDEFYTARYTRGYVEIKGSRDIIAGIGFLSLQFYEYEAQQYQVYCGEETMASSFNPYLKDVEVLADRECGTTVVFPNGQKESKELQGVQISKPNMVDIEIMRADYLLLERGSLSKAELKRVNQRLRDQMQFNSQKMQCNSQSQELASSILGDFIHQLLKHVSVLDVFADFDTDSERSSQINAFQSYFTDLVKSLAQIDSDGFEGPALGIFMKLLKQRRQMQSAEESSLFSELQPLLKKALNSMTPKFKGQGVTMLVSLTPSDSAHFFDTFSDQQVHIRQENKHCREAAQRRGSDSSGTLVLIQKPSHQQKADPNLSLLSRTTHIYCLTEDGYIIDPAQKGVTSISYSNIENERNLETASSFECRIWMDGSWRSDKIQTTSSGQSIVCVTSQAGEITLVQRIILPSGGGSDSSTPLWLILMIVGICVGCVVLLVIIILVLKRYKKKKQLKHQVMPNEVETPRPKESNSNMLVSERKKTQVPETSRELNHNHNNSLEDIE